MNNATNGHSTSSTGGAQKLAGSAPIDAANGSLTLRRFHAGDAPGDVVEAAQRGELLPALLNPFRHMAGRVRTAYPLFLHPADGAGARATSLHDLLAEAALGRADLLTDNLRRIEAEVVSAMHGRGDPVGAREVIDRAAAEVIDRLGLAAEPTRTLREEVARVVREIPEGGRLLGLGDAVHLDLLLHAVRGIAGVRRRALARRVDDARVRLATILDAEDAKTGGGSDRVAATMGGDLFDLDSLAGATASTVGTVTMPAARRARIQGALEVLSRLSVDAAPLMTVVHDGSAGAWASARGLTAVESQDPCADATARWDAYAGEVNRMLQAVRVGELEAAGAYDPAVHDAAIQRMDWQSMSREELLTLPAVVAVVSADALAQRGLPSLSRLLVSAKPIQVVAEVHPGQNPTLEADADPLTGVRLELAHLGISHRSALVQQTSPTRPVRMLEAYDRALSATRAGLHVVVAAPVGGGAGRLGAWFHAEAAIDGRAHPLFVYDPDGGDGWARRIDCSGNPLPGEDWQQAELPYTGPEGETKLPVQFTYADFALLEPGLAAHFHSVPAGLDLAELVTVDAWLSLDFGHAQKAIPFIWAVDGHERLVRLALSRRLAFAARDRLDFWHTVQELGGVKSEYVGRAVATAREAVLEEARREREQLALDHARTVDEVRSAEAANALGRLAAALVEADPAALLGAGAAVASGAGAIGAAPTRPSPAAAIRDAVQAALATAPSEGAPANGAAPADEAAPAEAAPADEAEELSFDEPWIDTILCTSCNECIQINKILFVYDANKQATIGNPKGGSFAQLVLAAEKCPSRCIHPGKPLNPNEPQLDDLIARAEPFN